MISFMNLFCVLLNYWISPGWVAHMNLQLATYLCSNALQFYFFLQFSKFLPTDFLYLLPQPPKYPRKCIPHIPIGPKTKVINIKNETCLTKDPIKRKKNIKSPM